MHPTISFSKPSSSTYTPKKAVEYRGAPTDIGLAITGDFEPFEPDPDYSFKGRQQPSKDAWKTVYSLNGPMIAELPQLIQNLINSTWKSTEPAANAPRFAFAVGTRGQGFQGAGAYHPQVMPTKPVIPVKYDKSAIANDWKVFEQVKRINAVTFRGDTRPPQDVITRAGGFHPPNTRTDQSYLEKNIYEAFDDYLQRRYNRNLAQPDFLQAVRSSAPTVADRKLLVDYMMWRKICEREAVHMGRMAANECLKGYISTARAIDTSITFGTAYNSKPGWLYVTVVHSAFIVPWGKKSLWGTEEAEIAQWGPVPAERIVGFVHLDRFRPDGPIFIRRSFRKQEPRAFEKIFKIMSGKTPKAQDA